MPYKIIIIVFMIKSCSVIDSDLMYGPVCNCIYKTLNQCPDHICRSKTFLNDFFKSVNVELQLSSVPSGVDPTSEEAQQKEEGTEEKRQPTVSKPNEQC